MILVDGYLVDRFGDKLDFGFDLSSVDYTIVSGFLVVKKDGIVSIYGDRGRCFCENIILETTESNKFYLYYDYKIHSIYIDSRMNTGFSIYLYQHNNRAYEIDPYSLDNKKDIIDFCFGYKSLDSEDGYKVNNRYYTTSVRNEVIIKSYDSEYSYRCTYIGCCITRSTYSYIRDASKDCVVIITENCEPFAISAKDFNESIYNSYTFIGYNNKMYKVRENIFGSEYIYNSGVFKFKNLL